MQLTHIAFAFAQAESPDGTKIAFVGVGPGSPFSHLWVMNADGSSLRPLAQLANVYEDSQPAWSPDGDSIVYQQTNGDATELRLVRLDGSGDTALTSSVGTNEKPDWVRFP